MPRFQLVPDICLIFQIMQGGGATNFMDRAIINCAHALEEAWAWGFDVDVWRAHLNAQTWPEVQHFIHMMHQPLGL